MTTTTAASTPMAVTPSPQQVVVVSNQSQMHGLLETVLDAGQYDVVSVESTDHAYSCIKRLSPHLVIVCLDVDDIDGFLVLSMLKLDSDTRHIPVVTCTLGRDDEDSEEWAPGSPDDVFSDAPAMGMN
jgi:CheY-like chemotaxis protein